VPVKYGSDYHRAREILLAIANELVGDYKTNAQKDWDEMVKKFMIEKVSLEPIVTMVANDNWIEFTVRYLVDFKRRRSTKDLLFSKILDTFEATKGEVSIASTTVHLVDAPSLNVRLTDEKDFIRKIPR